MKTKINSFLTSDTSSSFPHFFRMLDNSYSLKVLKSECSSTWDCNWLLTVYLFLWNLKWSVNHHINIKVSYWSQVSFSKKLSFTVINICGLFFFLPIWVFFYEHSRITGPQGMGEGISSTPHYHFHPLHRHLDISRASTAESSPLHIGSSRTWTGNLWFPSASR